ncbi:MAG: hypothetical protein E5V92_21265, partial [Mesorhizobium sp.]
MVVAHQHPARGEVAIAGEDAELLDGGKLLLVRLGRLGLGEHLVADAIEHFARQQVGGRRCLLRPCGLRAGGIGERAFRIDPRGECLARVRAEIALRLTRIKTFAFQRRLDRHTDLVGQRLADADQV